MSYVILTESSCDLTPELVERAGEAGVHVYGMSQYYLDGSAPDSSTVVAGYAGLRDGEIREAAELLKKAWTKRG